MERYVYEPLPPILAQGKTPPYTRLVRILPGRRDEPLRCTLFIVNVEAPPSYEALSYVWGPPTGTIDPHVLCDDRPVSITPNLDGAMRWLRYHDRERLFWIDAICIDQENIEERGRQVGYMRSVYSYASRAIVWLGPKTPGTEIAFESAKRMRRLANMPENPTEEAMYALLGMNEDQYDIGTFYISELLDVEYFSRIWCVQEIVASKVCIAKCEDLEMDFLYLLELIPYIIESRGEMLTTKPLSFWTGLPFLRQHNLQEGGIAGSIGPILNILAGTKDFNATNPRDKVFALFGISNEGLLPDSNIRQMRAVANPSWKVRLMMKLQENVTDLANANRAEGSRQFGVPPALVPDYKKTTKEVYRDLARYMMRVNPRHLNVLSHVQHTSSPQGGEFPSWVPKWNEPRQASPLSASVFYAGLWEGNHAFSANIEDHPMYQKPKEPDKLKIEGFKLDHVIKMTDVMIFDLHSAWPAEQIWSQLFSFALFPHDEREIMRPYRTGERLDMAFLLAATASPLGKLGTAYDYRSMLLSNTVPAGMKDIKEVRASARADVAAFILENTPMDTTQLPHYAVINEMAKKGKAVDFKRQAKIFAHNRRVFLTSTGYLGIGPVMMQPGDEVCILFGGRVPFVLRAMGDHHLFIGDCYIMDDDVMWGKPTEEVKGGRAPGVRTVMFELR